MADKSFHIDSGFSFVRSRGQRVSGDVCLMQRKGRRTVVALADGAGTGIKANIVAETIASMCASYCLAGYPPEKMARAVLSAFPPAGEGQDYACFTTVMFDGREAYITVFGNPDVLIFRNDKPLDIRNQWEGDASGARHGSFSPSVGDRIVLYTDGITQSGLHTKRLPEGWGEEGLREFTGKEIGSRPDISSAELSRRIVAQAEINDLFSPRNDMTAAVVYFRRPRRLMVCSGPPFNDHKDAILADMVDKYHGRKVICGGTTSKIIARELGREISVSLGRDTSGLPPVSRMEGIDMITEGVLTLSRAKQLLETPHGVAINEKGPAGELVRLMLDSDRIEFVVGTRINPMHQDPSLPVELELRRNIIKELAALLQDKFLKEVTVDYI